MNLVKRITCGVLKKLGVASSMVVALVISLQALAGTHFNKDTYYIHPLLTEAQCEKAHAKGRMVNCNQTLSLTSDGRATVVLTDVRNYGTYEIDGKQIVVKFEVSHDAGDEMTFTLSKDGESLKDESGNLWVLTE